MAKQPKTIDTSSWATSDTIPATQPSGGKIDTSNWKPVVDTRDFNIGALEKQFEDQKAQEEAMRKELGALDGLDDSEINYAVDASKKGMSKAEVDDMVNTFRGLNPKQKQITAHDPSGKSVTMSLDQIPDGFIKSSVKVGKALEGLGSRYYMKDNGKGIKVPVPLAYGERPEAGYTVDSIWGSDKEAEDDVRATDIAKKVFNLIPKTLEGAASLIETGAGLVANDADTQTAFNEIRSTLDYFKMKTNPKFSEGIVDTSKVEKFSDIFNSETYDFSGEKLLNTTLDAGLSIAQLLLTRRVALSMGASPKIANVAASFTTNLSEPLQAAEAAGVEGRGKYLVAMGYSTVASALELGLGIEGKILNNTGQAAKKQMIKQLIKDNIKTVDGQVTKESLDNLFAATAKATPSFFKSQAKNMLSEATEEVAQNMAQNAIQQMHDVIVKDDPDAAKYNSHFMSPKALAEYINSGLSGAIGGLAGGAVLGANDKQSQTVYDAVQQGPEKVNELKVDLTSSFKRGKITKEQFDMANMKIDSYNSYYQATKNRNISDEDKRKVFDLTYQKQNLSSSIETLKENNPGGINDGLIKSKESQVSGLNEDINQIWKTYEKPVTKTEQAQQEIPKWKSDLDAFSKQVNNQDKSITQHLVTRKDIETATGMDKKLNELARGINVEFKSPYTPEGGGNIKVTDGKMIVPITVKAKEGEDTIGSKELPVYAFEDKDGNNWMFAPGQKTKDENPDISYLVKLDNEGNYEDHHEFYFETPKKGSLTFDNIPDVFDKLGLSPIKTSKESSKFTGEIESMNDENESMDVLSQDESLFDTTLDYVSSNNGQVLGTIVSYPNSVFGVNVNGNEVKFASSTGYMNKDNLPGVGGQVIVKSVETAFGDGLMVVNAQTGEEIGYLRATNKSKGKAKKSKPSNISLEDSIEVNIPTTLTTEARRSIAKIERDQSKYEKVETPEGTKYKNKRTGNEYKRVSTFISGKEGGDFVGDKNLKATAYNVGKMINNIVQDYFNGTIRPYTEYEARISKEDYSDIIDQLNSVRNFAKNKGFSIITKPLVIADDVNNIAGQPNLIMIDKDGNFYVYDVSTFRNKKSAMFPEGRSMKDLLETRYKDKTTGEERRSRADMISAQVNVYADILKNKYDIDVKGVGVIPFNVDYDVVSEGKDYRVSEVVPEKRVNFKMKHILPILKKDKSRPSRFEGYEKGKTAYELASESDLDFKNEKELLRYVADHSKNPLELAEGYLQMKDYIQKNKGKSYKYDVLEDNNITITEKDFNQYFDKNILDDKIKNRFIRKTATPMDEKLKELSEDSGVEITPEDFGDFLTSISRGSTTPTINLKRAFVNRFYELTEKTITPKLANDVVKDAVSRGVHPEMFAEESITEPEITEQEAADYEIGKEQSEQAAANDQEKGFIPTTPVKSPRISDYLSGPDIIRGNEGDVPFQKMSSIEGSVDKVIDHLKKANPAINIKVEQSIIDESTGDLISGYAEGNTVKINANYSGIDTPIHEIGHILIDSIGYNNRVIQSAIKQLEGTELWNEVKKKYPELKKRMFEKEVLAEAIGREGAGVFETEVSKSKFKQALDYIFDKIKRLFGIEKNLAKSLAKQVIRGGVKGKASEKQLQKTRKPIKKTREQYYAENFASKIGVRLSSIVGQIDYLEGQLHNNLEPDQRDKMEAQLNVAKAKLETFNKAYKKYSFDYNRMNDLKKEGFDLRGKSIDELVQVYNTISEYDPDSNNEELAEVKYRIAKTLADQQSNFLEEKGVDTASRNFKDIKNKDVFMKALSHMSEAFPELQELSKMYDKANQDMQSERNQKLEKLNSLAKAVIKEEAPGAVDKVRGFFFNEGDKYFGWMDGGDGKFISEEKAQGLSKAKQDYLSYVKDLQKEYIDIQSDTKAGYEEDFLLMTDKDFTESLKSRGIVAAIQKWAGSNNNLRQVKMKFTDASGNTDDLTYGQIEQKLQKEGESGAISKAVASAKSLYYNNKAKSLLRAHKNEDGSPLPLSNSDFMLDQKGRLVNKFGAKKQEGYDYSKNFHAAAVQYINDMTWSKYMQPLVPIVESIEHFNNTTGLDRERKPNVVKWMQKWKAMHLYQEKPYSAFPALDVAMRNLRHLTSITALAFNVPAAKMNWIIGQYNNWRELGLKYTTVGNKRMVSVTPSGDKKFSKKARNIINKYNVVSTDYDERPDLGIGKFFDAVSQGLTRLAEYSIQGSLFLGQISKEDWAKFDENGNYTGDQDEMAKKVEEYKKRVSDVHGKYAAKDRRNFELYEFGKFIGQFRTWVPDWWKERFGEKYVDRDGKTHYGNFRVMQEYALRDLKKDVVTKEFWTSNDPKAKAARTTLKSAMVFASLLALRLSSDDDDRKRKKGDELGQVLGNLTFIFDPKQAKYTLTNWAPGAGTAMKFVDVLSAAINAERYKSKTDKHDKGDLVALDKAKGVLPYGKVLDIAD